jgi:hypothetical protein
MIRHCPRGHSEIVKPSSKVAHHPFMQHLFTRLPGARCCHAPLDFFLCHFCGSVEDDSVSIALIIGAGSLAEAGSFRY